MTLVAEPTEEMARAINDPEFLAAQAKYEQHRTDAEAKIKLINDEIDTYMSFQCAVENVASMFSTLLEELAKLPNPSQQRTDALSLARAQLNRLGLALPYE